MTIDQIAPLKNTFTDSDKVGGYAVFDDSVEKKHYDQVPAILDHLTYIDYELNELTGEYVFHRKRLTPTDKEVYRIIRQRAQGGKGACWKNTITLADHVGCSVTSIVASKRALTQSFEQLEGGSLINIEEKYIKRLVNDKLIKVPQHIITVLPVWAFNEYFMDKLDHKNPGFQSTRKVVISQSEASLAIEAMGQPGPVTLARTTKIVRKSAPDSKNGTRSRPDSKNGTSSLEDLIPKMERKQKTRSDTFVKNTYTADQAKARAAALASLSIEDLNDCLVNSSTAHRWLMDFGFKHAKATEIMGNHGLIQIALAANHLKDYKKPVTGTYTGFLLHSLDGRWYLPR